MFIKRAIFALMAGSALGGAAHAAEDIKLPQMLVWTAYDVGSSGYSHAVAFGSTFKNQLDVTLRVLPGKNDVSRLIPLRDKKADYSLTGTSDITWAQEAMYVFTSPEWGPQRISQIITSNSDATPSLGTTMESGIKTVQDIRGKRVAWVKGAPSLQNSTRAILAFGGLDWDDVVKVEIGGYGATFNALAEGQVDVIHAFTNSAGYLKVANSPKGLYLIPVPHDDKEGWERLKAVTPYNFPAIAKDGPGLPPEGVEMFSSPYPILVTMDERPADEVYNMTKAMVTLFDDYKDNAPGMIGYAVDRQRFSDTMTPFHEGAVRYYKEIGAWSDEAQSVLDQNKERREIVNKAWEEYTAKGVQDSPEFRTGWMKVHADVLNEAGMNPIAETWDLNN